MVPVGLGVLRAVHAVPFQRSLIALLARVPTARHPLTPQQEMPLSWASVTGGAAVKDQDVPFHTSAIEATARVPTATQRDVDTHETAVSHAEPAVAGVATGVHFVPSNRCASVWPMPFVPTR